MSTREKQLRDAFTEAYNKEAQLRAEFKAGAMEILEKVAGPNWMQAMRKSNPALNNMVDATARGIGAVSNAGRGIGDAIKGYGQKMREGNPVLDAAIDIGAGQFGRLGSIVPEAVVGTGQALGRVSPLAGNMQNIGAGALAKLRDFYTNYDEHLGQQDAQAEGLQGLEDAYRDRNTGIYEQLKRMLGLRQDLGELGGLQGAISAISSEHEGLRGRYRDAIEGLRGAGERAQGQDIYGGLEGTPLEGLARLISGVSPSDRGAVNEEAIRADETELQNYADYLSRRGAETGSRISSIQDLIKSLGGGTSGLESEQAARLEPHTWMGQ